MVRMTLIVAKDVVGIMGTDILNYLEGYKHIFDTD